MRPGHEEDGRGRVTARIGEPFVRVFTEEKDRPTLFVVDQRINIAGR